MDNILHICNNAYYVVTSLGHLTAYALSQGPSALVFDIVGTLGPSDRLHCADAVLEMHYLC